MSAAQVDLEPPARRLARRRAARTGAARCRSASSPTPLICRRLTLCMSEHMDLDSRQGSHRCDEVDKRADVLLDVSHQIHDHPELGFEEHFAHDLLTGDPRGRGARGRAQAPTASRHGVRGPRRQRGPDDRGAVRVRRAARHRSRLRAQHHRAPPGSAPGWPRPRWPTSSAAGCVDPRHAGRGGRRRQGAAWPSAARSRASTPR